MSLASAKILTTVYTMVYTITMTCNCKSLLGIFDKRGAVSTLQWIQWH